MEMQPQGGMDDQLPGSGPEDDSLSYSRTNLKDWRSWGSSATRREYGAQIRHHAAEELRQMELRAQSEAEANASQAEAEAQTARAEAAAAGARIAASRSMMPISAGWEVEEQIEHMRRAALREAAQQARRAAAERLEAARRAEAAALADSIARREEREIAEAQAVILRQAAKYAEAEMRSRRRRYLQPEFAASWRGAGPFRARLAASGDDDPGQREKQVLDLGHAPAVEEARHLESSRSHLAPEPAPEIVSRIPDPQPDDVCWCEAESLIGCGYSKLEGAPSRNRHPSRSLPWRPAGSMADTSKPRGGPR